MAQFILILTPLSFLLVIFYISPISAFASISPPKSTTHRKYLSPIPISWDKKSVVNTRLQVAKDNSRARLEKGLEDMMENDWREFRARLVAWERAETAANIINEEKSPNFDGNFVGGATDFLRFGASSLVQDPFLSEEEHHVLFDPKIRMNKHHWAHPLSHVEPGCILVANERLGGMFHQTVVLVVEYNRTFGSKGLIINRPFNDNLMKVASGIESNADSHLQATFGEAPVGYGGPVLSNTFATLHGFGEVTGSKKICPGVFAGGSYQLMEEVRTGNMHPKEVLFVKGHVSWIPGQLDREIENGVWYSAAASSDLILRYTGTSLSNEDSQLDLWTDILSCMGNEFEERAVSHCDSRGDVRAMP